MTLTPLQFAIERTTRKTSELHAFDRKLASGEDPATFTAMTEAIMLAVDNNSPTSVANYRALLEDDELSKKRRKSGASSDEDEAQESADEEDDLDLDDDEPKQLTPLQHALKIALIDHALAINKCLSHLTRTAHQATKADLTPSNFTRH